MDEPKERKITEDNDWLRISHRFGRDDDYGDTELEARPDSETFQLEMSRDKGRDDAYGYGGCYDECEIALNEEEARALHLLLHMWLEARSK